MIIDYLKDITKERKSIEEYSDAQRKAIRIFLHQKEAIKEIKDTRGFKEIVDYLDREIEACDSRLNTTKNQDAWKEVYAERKACNGLKQFLQNLAVH